MRTRRPTHPGEIIKEFCIDPLELSITDAAKALGVTRKTLSTIVNMRGGISPEMALRLSKVFGRTADGWLSLQMQYDLWKVRNSTNLENLKRIHEKEYVS